MLLKSKDGRQEDIQELNWLLTLRPTVKQRSLIERKLKCLVSGERNEQNSAYYLDFRYKDSANYAVIHDLRIEHRRVGRKRMPCNEEHRKAVCGKTACTV